MTARCPICRKPTDSKNDSGFPFCSERCRLLDLGNWASEKYRISSPVFDESELEEEDQQAPRSGRNHSDEEDDNAQGVRGHR
jgi:endogenous inhibitor of DNA gyrase (YacG/DUF329 family)